MESESALGWSRQGVGVGVGVVGACIAARLGSDFHTNNFSFFFGQTII